jgi:hypothetical protein
MAITNEIETFGSGGFHGISGHTGCTIVAASASPNESYCASLGNPGAPDTLTSNAFAQSGVMVKAVWLKFDSQTDIIGDESAFMQCRDLVTGLPHWYLTWKDGGTILAYDADGNVITGVAGIIAGRWYLIEVRWERGDPKSFSLWRTEDWVGTGRVSGGTFGGLNLDAGNVDLYLYFACPFNAVVANEMQVSSWYNRINSTSEADLLGKFEGLTYVTDHASTDYDIGDKTPTDQWVKGADIPFGSGDNMNFFGGNTKYAAKGTRLDDDLYGPAGDVVVTGEIYGIKGTWDGFGRESKSPIIGRWTGAAGSHTVGGTPFTGGNVSLVLDGAHANCPAADEYCLIGVQSNSLLDPVWIVDMCATVLTVAEKPITRGTHHGGRDVIIVG